MIPFRASVLNLTYFPLYFSIVAGSGAATLAVNWGIRAAPLAGAALSVLALLAILRWRPPSAAATESQLREA
jgi:hypothetical protein